MPARQPRPPPMCLTSSMEKQRKLAELFQQARKQPTTQQLKSYQIAPPTKIKSDSPAVKKKESKDRKPSSSWIPKPSSDSKRHQRKQLLLRTSREDDPVIKRTIFIGNLPTTITKKEVSKIVSPYGKIESLRQRSAAIFPGKLPVPVARKLGKQITGHSVNYYVVMATEDSALACMELNGNDVKGRHIRVDMATPTINNKNSVFVGNLPFNTEEEQLRKAFESYGEIDGVRIIRDNRTGIGKGFAYIRFKDNSGVLFACKHNEKLEYEGRKLRIFRCRSNKEKRQTKFGGRKAHRQGEKTGPSFKKRRKGRKDRALSRPYNK